MSRLVKVLGLFILCSTFLFSQAKDDEPKKEEIIDNSVEENLDDAKKALEFGIDTTVIGVISQARQKKDTRLVDSIAVLVDSVNDAVVIEVLNFFDTVKKHDQIIVPLGNRLKSYQNISDNLAVRALRFLISAKAKPDFDLIQTLKDMATLTSKERQTTAIEVIGELDIPDAVNFLRDLYKKIGSELSLRKACIQAIGQKKDAGQLSFFKNLYEDSGEDKEVKRAALVAIGKLADEASLPVIRKAITAGDIFEREAAINALSGYEIAKVIESYKQALRDGAWRNRAKVLDIIKNQKIAQLTSQVVYMAEKDPEKPVKAAALSALVDFGDQWSVMNNWLMDKKIDQDFKKMISQSVVPKQASFILTGLKKVIEDEWKVPKSGLLVAICRDLSLSEVSDGALFLHMLEHPDESIKLNGIRGIVTNKLVLLKGNLMDLSKKESGGTFKAALDDAVKRL